MLIFSQAKLSVCRQGRVRVEGKFEPYWSRISGFVRELGIRDITVRLRDGHPVFPKSIPRRTQKQFRTFLRVECPVRKK
jgi:hypothetical protein